MNGLPIASHTPRDDHDAILLFFERVPAAAWDRDAFRAQLRERIERALRDADRTGRAERR